MRRGSILGGPAGATARSLLTSVFCILGSLACAAGEHPKSKEPVVESHPDEHGGPHDATVHHSFSDAEEWAKVFDDPAREAWQKPAETVAALGLREGMMAADLGAGTGYFASHLALAVGERGLVLEIDPEPDMVRYLGRRAHAQGLTNILPVLAQNDEPFLPRARVDRVLIVNTYHHIDDRPAYFSRMRKALAPGGQVAVVDFHKRPLPVGPPPEQKLEPGVVIDEMRQAGYRLASEKTFLPYQYFLIFEPADTTAGALR